MNLTKIRAILSTLVKGDRFILSRFVSGGKSEKFIFHAVRGNTLMCSTPKVSDVRTASYNSAVNIRDITFICKSKRQYSYQQTNY